MKLTYSQRCSLPAMLPARALRGRRFLVPCAAFINGQPKAAAAKPGSGRAGDDNAATRGSVPPAPVQELQGFYARKLPTNKLEGKAFGAPAGDQRVGFVATADTGQGEVLLVVPEELAITSVDAEKHPLVGPVAQQCSELVALTLWLLAERAQGPDSKYTALLATLPEATLSPILWTDADIGDRLRGSPSMQEAKNRKSAMVRQWEVLAAQHLTDGGRFPPAVFNEQAFCQAFSVVIGHATYLPSAECFSLLPLVSIMGRTGEDSGARLDFNAEQGAVVLTASRPYREGQEVLLADGRPNGELLLSTGSLHDGALPTRPASHSHGCRLF